MMDTLATIETLSQLLRHVHAQFDRAELYYGHGTDNAWDEAVQLVLHVMELPVDSDDSVNALPVTAEQVATAQACVAERITTRTPLAYLLHRAWFMNLPFYVDERVIVPRSPFAEWVERRLIPWVDPDNVTSILDMCTGSACIAIATAMCFPQARVDAVDIDAGALAVATINVAEYGLQQRVQLFQSDGFGEMSSKAYDVILCNPPYVSLAEMDTLPSEYLHEPRHALHAEQDGLALVVRLLTQAAAFLAPRGIIMMEVGNSDELLQTTFPEVPFVWLEQDNGGHGIFVLTHDELLQHQAVFMRACDGR